MGKLIYTATVLAIAALVVLGLRLFDKTITKTLGFSIDSLDPGITDDARKTLSEQLDGQKNFSMPIFVLLSISVVFTLIALFIKKSINQCSGKIDLIFIVCSLCLVTCSILSTIIAGSYVKMTYSDIYNTCMCISLWIVAVGYITYVVYDFTGRKSMCDSTRATMKRQIETAKRDMSIGTSASTGIIDE